MNVVRRRKALLKALAATCTVLAVGLAILHLLAGGVPTPRQPPAEGAPRPEGAGPPEGKLLIFTNTGPTLLGDALSGPLDLEPALLGGDPSQHLVAYDLSPDGSRVLGAIYEREPTFITRETALLIIGVPTGARSVIVRAHRKEDLGPAEWSPDGLHVAYRLTTYRRDPARVNPGPTGDRNSILCVLDLSANQTSCFPGIRRVDGFDWSPDGVKLVVDVVGVEPLWLLDPTTGQASVLARPRGRWTERAGLGHLVSFTSPAWSPSGRYISAWANNTPMIFHADGRVAAEGHQSREFTEALGWSPSEDLFAHARGKPPYEINKVLLLDPVTGVDTRILSTQGQSYRQILDLVWSPSGRWLAILRWQSSSRAEIEFLDTTDPSERFTLRRTDSPRVVDWGP